MKKWSLILTLIIGAFSIVTKLGYLAESAPQSDRHTEIRKQCQLLCGKEDGDILYEPTPSSPDRGNCYCLEPTGLKLKKEFHL